MNNEEEIAESLRGHQARNEELLRSVRSKGVDLAKTHSVDHHFWAPDRSTAAALAAELYSRGYLITAISRVQNDAHTAIWNVEAQMHGTLEEAGSLATAEELVRLSARFDAVYDGWGAAI